MRGGEREGERGEGEGERGARERKRAGFRYDWGCIVEWQ